MDAYPFLKEIFDGELNQTRSGSWIGTGDNTKVGVIICATCCVGRRELNAIHDVEKLHPEFQTSSVLLAQHGSFECREIEIADSIGPQGWIDARFGPKREIRRRGKACRIEPDSDSIAPLQERRLVAIEQQIWTRTGTEQCRVIHLLARKHKRKSPLKCGDAIHAPIPQDLVQKTAPMR